MTDVDATIGSLRELCRLWISGTGLPPGNDIAETFIRQNCLRLRGVTA